MNEKIVVVTEGDPHIWAIVNALASRFGSVAVILEAPESKKAMLMRRARRQGWVSVVGQLGTMVLIRLGKRFFAGRTERIVKKAGLDIEPVLARRSSRRPRPIRRTSWRQSKG